MDASVSSSILTAPTPKVLFFRTSPSSKPTLNFRSKSKGYLLIGNQSLKTRRVAAINDVSAAADAVPVDLTWQIVVGAIAGVTPFVVAGIEFSKRIVRLECINSTEKMRGMWRIRASSEERVLCAVPWMWRISTMAIVEEILFWLSHSYFHCHYVFGEGLVK
ncbi:hypothetical protein FEM48_Zijuj01G0245500 [Ziziphus jujuba var. spinosa]|uniref:Uncharacterized protein n=1 Tax=Ziziphus jujuba var. spinosa TaxID=714518 RepID=A0A978W4H4_ZIZJJ|nr:hypothetical protein FEM48_Zijuj01G0245500 [Ziziphus jujuba var. spinosa]